MKKDNLPRAIEISSELNVINRTLLLCKNEHPFAVLQIMHDYYDRRRDDTEDKVKNIVTDAGHAMLIILTKYKFMLEKEIETL